MVSNEEIKRRLELRRRGINPDNEHDKEDKVICSKCHTANIENANFCIGCGNELNKLPEYTLKINEAESNMLLCPECGNENKINSKFCTRCGSNLLEKRVTPAAGENEVESLVCPECSFENSQNSKFCIGCGANLKEASNEENINLSSTKNDEKEVRITIKDGNMSDEEAPLDTEVNSKYDMGEEDVVEQASEASILDEIKKAKELLDMGAISPEEYQKIKDNYLDLLN